MRLRWLTALCIATDCHASSLLNLQIDHLRYGSLDLQRAQVSYAPDQGKASFALDRLQLPFPPEAITDLRFDCGATRWSGQAFECRQGRLRSYFPLWKQSLSGNFSGRLGADQGQLTLSPLRFGNGRWQIRSHYRNRVWRAKVEAANQNLKALWLKSLWPNFFAWLDKLEGNIDLTLETAGAPALVKVAGKLVTDTLNFNDPEFKKAGENLKAALQLQFNRNNRNWRGKIKVQIDQGDALFLPIYLPFQKHPLSVEAQLELSENKRFVSVSDFLLSHSNFMNLFARGGIDNGIISSLAGTFNASLPDFGKYYLAPFLEGGNWQGLAFRSGKATGRLSIDHNLPEDAGLRLVNVIISDDKRRLGFHQLNADLNWRRRLLGTGRLFPASWLAWQSGHFYRIPLGATKFYFRTTGDDLHLLQTAIVPILKGRLQIQQLAIRDVLSATPDIEFAGKFESISLEGLTRVLGLPPLAGTVSGVIPRVAYRRHHLKVDGQLIIRAFDGSITVRNLSISNLFGPLPRLQADIELDNLDLEQITRHFSFGRITGRLQGVIRDLTLENWRPVSFDAWLGTPEDDHSKHRINQQAVENLADLGGGGAAGLLSRNLLKIFKEFSYDRIGLGCRLQKNVCLLRGVAPARQGYYIVKGGGLPRIDVIGYNRRIDWPTLVARLARITQLQSLESPVIQP